MSEELPSAEWEQRTSSIWSLVRAELARAERRHPAMRTPHEGYAVILEELDELWAEIKRDEGRSQFAISEAVQVAAMAMRYILNLT